MNKIKISKKVLENAKFSFDGEEIEVIPYLDKTTQDGLIKVYFSAYFLEDGKEDRLGAEVINKMAILDLVTNIDIDVESTIDTGSGKLVNLIDYVASSGLWLEITKRIKNYREYEYNLSVALESKKKENGDIGFFIKKVVTERILPILEKVEKLDISNDTVSEIKDALRSFSGEIKGTPFENIIKNKVA